MIYDVLAHLESEIEDVDTGLNARIEEINTKKNTDVPEIATFNIWDWEPPNELVMPAFQTIWLLAPEMSVQSQQAWDGRFRIECQYWTSIEVSTQMQKDLAITAHALRRWTDTLPGTGPILNIRNVVWTSTGWSAGGSSGSRGGRGLVGVLGMDVIERDVNP